MRTRETPALHPSPPAQQAPVSSAVPTVAPALSLDKAYRVPGYLPGMRQPALLVDVMVSRDASAQALKTFAKAIGKVLPGAAEVALHPSFQSHPALGAVVRATQAILRQAGFSMLDPPTVHKSARAGAPLKLVVPAYVAQQEALDALYWASDLMNCVVERTPVASALAALPRVVERIDRHAPGDANTPAFLAAASAMDIPWRHVFGNVYEYGWGSRARRLESTITGATSAIGIAAAKDKRTTALLLRAAGIPVPHHELAGDADHAVRIAARIGYPVVVKPAAADGGLGVGAGLPNEAAVRRAFAAASEISEAILVEAFVKGNDYRVDVLDGEVYSVMHRVPGGVVGDGANSVARLLAKLNADPRRGERGTAASLKRIHLDAEAREFLSLQGLDANSIPPEGQVVRLRGAANVAMGATPFPVTDKAHPDNVALCVRAARVLGLDVAGVDLLIPDIGRSWLETGAGICEVNGKPKLPARNVRGFLERLLPGEGRIPVVMVLGPQDESLYRTMAISLASLGRVGTAWEHEVRVGSAIVAKAPSDTFSAGQALLTDPAVDAAVIGISAGGAGHSGLPVDRFDVLVLAGTAPGAGPSAEWKRWQALALTLAPLCRGRIILDSECPQWQPIIGQLDAGMVVSTPYGGLADAVRNHFQTRGRE
ncbi:acetate--CoA ligase family protein [Ramlibacter sp. WS9]|uniref:ATP-binding protein n=1 Tax=Ramlibacter sp. WS9 TaxID=1882741 RepID=UPI0013052D42|nr:acetate--CoA ligase family protein [Ramlibacter sp. WS9]